MHPRYPPFNGSLPLLEFLTNVEQNGHSFYCCLLPLARRRIEIRNRAGSGGKNWEPGEDESERGACNHPPTRDCFDVIFLAPRTNGLVFGRMVGRLVWTMAGSIALPWLR
jgi:hypothetical protein